jgi:transposase
MSANRTKHAYPATQYRGLAGRRGKLRAREAVGHSLLVGVWHILAEGVVWNDLGADYYDRRPRPRMARPTQPTELGSLGWNGTTNHDGTTTLTPPAAA